MKTFILSFLLMFSVTTLNAQDVQPHITNEHQVELRGLSRSISDMVYAYLWENHYDQDSIALSIEHFSIPDLHHRPYCNVAMDMISSELEDYSIDNCEEEGYCNSMNVLFYKEAKDAHFNINVEFIMEKKRGGVLLDVWIIMENNGKEGFWTGSLLPPSLNKKFFIDDDQMLELFN